MNMTTNWHSSIGRPSKGPRDALMIRPRQELGELIRAQAEAEGMSISDYVAAAMARALERPELAPEDPTDNKRQGELPLSKTA